MPFHHALRRWLWRVNALLALGLLALGGRIAFGPVVVEAPMPRLESGWGEVGAQEVKPPVDFQELRRECARFWPMTSSPPRPAPRPVAKPTRPPLGAYEVAMWIRSTGQPDGILLLCKDRAHPESFIPVEGRPDRGVSLVGIRVEGPVAWITVARGEETFTYRFPLRSLPDPRLVRITSPSHPGPGEGEPLSTGSRRAGGGEAALALRDLKCVPFFGSDGRVVGLRVTGVRPGSRFESLGLKRNDVVVRCGGAKVEGFVDLARGVAESSRVDLTVRRKAGHGEREVGLRGG
ncbi:MAG: hypothetical protein ACC662_08535 [Planctomycetota bacterium]